MSPSPVPDTSNGRALPGDQRLSGWIDRLRQTAAVFDGTQGRESDAASIAALQPASLPTTVVGTVVYSHPHLHWLLVQTRQHGMLGCCALATGSLTASGVRAHDTPPPGAQVLVHQPPGWPHGICLGSLPRFGAGGLAAVLPDRLAAGSPAGMAGGTAHRAILSLTGDAPHHIFDFAAGRPLDGTPLDWARLAETGVGLHVSPFEAFIRVSEACGLFLNYLDEAARFYARQLDAQWAGVLTEAHEIGGELSSRHAECIYPWELDGALRPEDLAAIRDRFPASGDPQAQARGALDLAVGMEAVEPLARVVRYGGYLGQGGLRQVVIPASLQGQRRRDLAADEPADRTVFEESVGLDGSYRLQSASKVMLLKRTGGWSVRRKRSPQDPEADSGSEGHIPSGDSSVRPLAPQPTGEDASARRAAGVADAVARSVGWESKHPFAGHPREFDVRQPEDGPRVQEDLDFGQLQDQGRVRPPDPQPQPVDHRDYEAQYYEREAGVVMLEDGGVAIYGGAGEQILMSGGNVTISCPGDVILQPGRSLAALAGRDVALRAKRSADVTAGTGDLRLKAEHNLQALAGNSGSGGILLESLARGVTQQYAGKVGEDVVSSGVVVRAPDSGFAVAAGEVYLRTGVDGGASRGITLDADKGRSPITLKSQATTIFASSAVQFAYGAGPEGGEVSAAHVFGSGGVVLDGNVGVSGGAVFRGNLAVTGGGSFGGSLGAGSQPGKLRTTRPIASAGRRTADSVSAARENATSFHDSLFAGDYYTEHRPGNDTLLGQMGFSYRDDASQTQYGTASLAMPEPRWNTMVRLGGSTGGEAWVEPPVFYQGQALQAWPGREAWEGGSLVRTTGGGAFDYAAGRDKPLTQAAHTQQTPPVEAVPLDGNLQVLA